MNYQLIVSSDDPNDLVRILAALDAGNALTITTGTSGTPSAPGMPSLPGSTTTTHGAASPTQTAGSSSSDDSDEGAPNPNAPLVDSAGMPWDERIHAGTKGVNADGTWKARRGGPKGAELGAIEAELRARAGQPAPAPVMPAMPVAAPAMPAPVMPAMPVAAPLAAPAMPAPVMPMPVPQPEPAPAPVAQPVATPTDFHSFMTEISTRTGRPGPDGAPLVHAEYLAQLAQRISMATQQTATPRTLNSITDLAEPANADLIPYAVSVMQHDQRW